MNNLDVCSVIVQSLKTETAANFENSGSEFGRPKKAENLGKNSPKIQGVRHDHFRNLSMDPATSDTKITSLDPLGVEKLGVKI